MEILGSGSVNYGYRPPTATYVEKLSDLKTAKVGKSILKSKQEQTTPSARTLRFEHEVIHKQTYGKIKEDGTYEVLVKITRLPLIDETYADGITTKETIINLEQEIVDQRKLIDEGHHVDSEDLYMLQQTEQILMKMNSLFDGRRTLPFKLPKTSPRDFKRDDKRLAAGSMTGTENQSTIRTPDSPSWEIDAKKVEKLKKLHDEAIAKIPSETTTAKKLLEIMLELREYHTKEKIDKHDLYNIYVDFDKKKEKFRSSEVIHQLEKTPLAQERQEILNRFYQEELLPMETGDSVDNDQIKDLLEENLDVILDDNLTEASYSDITVHDLLKFLKEKYNLK
jgi:hypothetical protein